MAGTIYGTSKASWESWLRSQHIKNGDDKMLGTVNPENMLKWMEEEHTADVYAKQEAEMMNTDWHVVDGAGNLYPAVIAPDSMEQTKGSIYIAGPMRGYPNFNFPAFFIAEFYLTEKNWTVFNPAKADNLKYGTDVSANNSDGSEEWAAKEFGLTINDAMARDLEWIARHATAIYMLKGWEKSTGARAEHALAVALGLDIYYEVTI